MPFRSRVQSRFMFSQHPKIAKRWAKEGGGKGSIKPLPFRIGKKARKKR